MLHEERRSRYIGQSMLRVWDKNSVTPNSKFGGSVVGTV
jgi:hypothetical protein